MSGTSTPATRTVPLTIVAGLFLASIALRPQLLAIGPLLPFIRDDLGIPASIAGLITTIPVLCMGIFAPIGPRVAARLGPRLAFASCLALIAGFGLIRAAVPSVELLLLATFGIGVGIGIAGAVPSMVVSQHLPGHRAMGTGAYAGRHRRRIGHRGGRSPCRWRSMAIGSGPWRSSRWHQRHRSWHGCSSSAATGTTGPSRRAHSACRGAAPPPGCSSSCSASSRCCSTASWPGCRTPSWSAAGHRLIPGS